MNKVPINRQINPAIKKTILILLLSIANNLMAQKDTLYFKLDTVFHTNWIKATKNDAEFYRPMPLKKVGNLYQIKDYYSNGNVQMEGFITNPENAYTYEGKVIWYYKNGNIEIESTYTKWKLNGLKKTYFEDGSLKTEGTYKDDDPLNGTFNDCCPYPTVDERKKGKRIASYRYYKDSKVIAEKSINDEDGHTKKILAYNKKGEQIAEVTVKPIEHYIDGKNVWFHIDKDKNILNIEGFATYKNGILEGESSSFDLKGNSIAKGIYQNGIPYSGTFFNDQILKTYKNGKLEGKEIAYSNDKIIAQGINKDGYHWDGQFKILYYQIETYKNGQLEGKQTIYYTDSFGYYIKEIKSYHHFINNKKEGESAHFDKKGKQIAKGIYKNDIPFTGTFYDEYYNTLTSYKEGEKHGMFIWYNRDGEIVTQQEYENGKIAGLVKSESYIENKTCECQYKNGKPFDGEVCKSYSVLHYKNGKIVKKETYNSNDLKTLEEVKTYTNEGLIAQNSTFFENKSYQLTYKNNKPFNGEEFSTFDRSLTTYKDGVKNGPFTEYTYEGVFIEGNYQNNLWDGTLTFDDRLHNKTSTCIYKNGEPIDGNVISNNCITNYKNGLKTGLESCNKNLHFKINNEYELIYDSIVKNYKNGKLHGKIQYFKEQNLVADGMYFFDSPQQGTFYVNKLFENYYEKGKLVRSTYYFGTFKKVDVFKDHLITNEVTYKNDTIIYKGNFKNGVENNGTFITIDDKKDPRQYILTQYKNGIKHGFEKTIGLDYKDEKLITIKDFYNGQLTKKTTEMAFNGNQKIEGSYHEGKPFSGSFYSRDDIIEKVERYQNRIKTGYQYYAVEGSNMERLLDSIYYKNGKPNQGNELEQYKSQTHQHVYKNGQLTKTNIYNFGIAKIPNIEVIYTDNGFITNYIKSVPGVERTAENVVFEKYNELSYSNAAKTEGKVEFFTEKEKGYLKFKNDELIEIQIDSKVSNILLKMYFEMPNVLVVDFKNTNIDIKMYPEFKFSSVPIYKDFLSFNDLFFKGDGIAHFYLETKLLSTCVIKKGDPYDGIIIRQYEDEMFKYSKYKEGKRMEKKKGLTKDELLNLINKL